MKFLSLVWSNLKRKKLRTSLTLLSIFVAFVLYGLLCTIKEAFTAGISVAGADRLVVRHKVSLIMTLPVTYGRRMEQVPGVASAVHFTWFNGIYQNESKNFFGSFPTDPEPFLALYPEILLPEEQKQAWLKTRTGAIVAYGPDYADLCRRAASYADRILKGTKPANLAVQEPTKLDLIVNMRTAKALGLAIPESLRLQATETIE